MKVRTCDDASLVLEAETDLEKSIMENWFRHRYDEHYVPYIGIVSGCDRMYISLRRPTKEADNATG